MIVPRNHESEFLSLSSTRSPNLYLVNGVSTFPSCSFLSCQCFDISPNGKSTKCHQNNKTPPPPSVPKFINAGMQSYHQPSPLTIPAQLEKEASKSIHLNYETPPLKLCRKPSITEDCNNGIMTIRLLSRFPLNWLKKEQEGDARKEPSTTRRRREKNKTSSVESSNDSSSSKSTLLSQELLGPIAPASQSNEESTLHSQELLAP